MRRISKEIPDDHGHRDILCGKKFSRALAKVFKLCKSFNFKVDLRYITYHSHIIKTDQSIQAFRETLLEKKDKPMRKRWIKRFAVVALATAVSVYTVPKTGLLAALGLSQTTEAEEASSDQKGTGGISSGVSDYSAVNKLTSDAVLDGQTITSTGNR